MNVQIIIQWFSLLATVDRAWPAVHMGPLEPRDQQTQEPLRQRDRLRPLPRHPLPDGGVARQRLHQRKLLRRLPQAERLHRDAGTTPGDDGWLLADGMGAEDVDCGHDDQAGGEK